MPTFSYIYSIPYIILFIVYFIFFLWENSLIKNGKSIKPIRVICMLVFLLFFGFRGYLDTDFIVYHPLFEDAPPIWDFEGISKFSSAVSSEKITAEKIEPGFKALLVLLKSISSNYFVLQFVSSLIDVICLNYFFKKYSPQYALSFALMLIFSGVGFEINLLRNSKSIFIFIYSLQFIKERKMFKYFLWNGIGLLFHSSAIFFFPLYFFLHRQLPKPAIWIVFIFGNIIYLLQLHFIGPLVSFVGSLLGGVYSLLADLYSNDEVTSKGYGITIGFIERFLSYILLFVNYKRISDYIGDQKKVNLFYNLFYIYFITSTFLSEFSVFIDRITMLFVFSYWILYSYLYVAIKYQLKNLLKIVVLIFGALKLYKSNEVIIRNYENVLWETRSYEDASDTVRKNIDDILSPE